MKSLEAAKHAQDTADGKRRMFVREQPVPPYDKGDQWSNATFEEKYKNDLLVCVRPKKKGEEFSIEDWQPAQQYTTKQFEASLNVGGKQIDAVIRDLTKGLERVGFHLDGENSTFDVVADTFKVVTTTGKIPFFTSGGKLNADFIDAKAIVAKGIKAQTIDAEGATFQNIAVTGKSKFGGELIGASGSFTQLNCVDTDSRVVASLRFSPEGRMVFDGDISSQGSKNVNGRNRALIYYASDIWCRGQFGHHSRTCVVVKDDMMYVHHSGHEYTDGLKIILERVTTRTGKEVYVIPLYSPGVAGSWGNNGEVVDYDNPKINELYSDPYKRENAEQLELPAGAPIDVVVFNCTRECLYKFVGMDNGKQWTVINGNDDTSVTICCHGGAFDVHGGYVLDCCYVNPVWLSPSSVDATSPGAGVMVGRELDMNW